MRLGGEGKGQRRGAAGGVRGTDVTKKNRNNIQENRGNGYMEET